MRSVRRISHTPLYLGLNAYDTEACEADGKIQDEAEMSLN
jgi:hypothetical protein